MLDSFVWDLIDGLNPFNLLRLFLLVSNRDLQIFASSFEFFVPAFTDQAVTPANAKISSQTPFGTGFTKPLPFDGVSIFAQADGKTIREIRDLGLRIAGPGGKCTYETVIIRLIKAGNWFGSTKHKQYITQNVQRRNWKSRDKND